MRLLPLILICAVFTVPSVASTLNYSEQNNYPGRDFPTQGFPLLGYLDVGTNTVSGWMFDENGDGSNPDIDTFSLGLVAGTEIVSEEINFSTTSNGHSISITEPIDGITKINGNLDTTLTPSTPITGLFDVEVQGIPGPPKCTGPGGTPPCTYLPVSYTLTYKVQDIPATTPEPSSLMLLGTGLLGLTGLLKRQLAA